MICEPDRVAAFIILGVLSVGLGLLFGFIVAIIVALGRAG